MTTSESTQTREYAHTPCYEDVQFLSGSYYKVLEDRLPYDGRDVLYFLGATSCITSCCGESSPGLAYIKVPGFVVKWQARATEAGVPVSMVEPIRDEKLQSAIASRLLERHGITQIEFW